MLTRKWYCAGCPSAVSCNQEDVMKFEVINNGYPLEVHRAGCRNIAKKLRGRGSDGWLIEGDTVDSAVALETETLNSQFDAPYKSTDLFTIYPCCR